MTSRALAASLLAATLAVLGCATADRTDFASLTESERIEIAHELAYRASQAEDPIEAQRHYLDAIDAHSSFAAAWNNLAVLLMDSRRMLEADEALQIAATVDPRDPRPVYNRGLLRHRNGQLDQAARLYLIALERDPNFLPALIGHIETDVVLQETDETTVSRIDRALRLETDPKRVQTLQLQRLRILDGPGPSEQSPSGTSNVSVP